MNELLKRHPALAVCTADIERAGEILSDTFRSGGKLLVCGNGGSAADAEHIVGELMKGYRLSRPLPSQARENLGRIADEDGAYLAAHLQGALPVISLVSQMALISAISNDTAADIVFAQQVWGYGREGDTLLGLSTSGGSRNVVLAVEAARALGMHTLGMTGPAGGRLASLCEVTIRVPGDSTAEVQEHHQPVYHYLCELLEDEFFG